MPRARSSEAARPVQPQDPREAVLAVMAECCAAIAENRVLQMRLGADPGNQAAVDALVISAGHLGESRAELARIGIDQATLAEAVAAGVAISEARRAASRAPAPVRALQVVPAPQSM